MSEPESVSHKITIADQTFSIRIRPEERDFYDRVARFTQEAYEDVRNHNVVGGPQAWAMTAFQLVTELFETRRENGLAAADHDRIRRIIERIERVIPQEG